MPWSSQMLRVVKVLACLLVLKTVSAVLIAYSDYFPANFRSDFLLGRDTYFYGAYQWAFYAHIITGPFVLVSGLALLSDSLRRRYPVLHRRLGRIHIFCVLFLVAPSGLWMARYTETGTIAAMDFGTLAIATAWCAAQGWQLAVQRRFEEHGHWMQRCFALLCSAVVLRVIGGLSDVFTVDWTYPFAAWASWLFPLTIIELLRIRTPSSHLPQ